MGGETICFPLLLYLYRSVKPTHRFSAGGSSLKTLKIMVNKKFKDYYDHLLSEYGINRNFLANRNNNGYTHNGESTSHRVTLYIGGYRIDGYNPAVNDSYYNEGKIYWGNALLAINDYEKMPDTFLKARFDTSKKGRYYHNKISFNNYLKISSLNKENVVIINMDKPITECVFQTNLAVDRLRVNEKLECPLICQINGKFKYYPQLTSLNVDKQISPELVCELISQWFNNHSD